MTLFVTTDSGSIEVIGTITKEEWERREDAEPVHFVGRDLWFGGVEE